MVNHQRIAVIKALSLIGIALTALVMLVGAWTRLSDAGLGCPDWPGCYGQWVVPTAYDAAVSYPAFPLEASKAWLEMFHRYIATLLGATAILLLWLGWPFRRTKHYPWRISVLLLLVIVAQGIFGALTVTLTLWPQVVTLHLLGGMGILSIFVWLHCRLKALQNGTYRTPSKASVYWWLVAVLLLGQLALGGWVSSNYAGISCQGFPSCNTQWWPDMDLSEGFHLTQTVGPNYLHGKLHADARTAIHMVHRLWGGLLGVAILMLWWRYRHYKAARGLVSVLKMYCLQVTLGIASVLLWLPLWLALLHTAGAMALTVSYLLAWWRWRYGPLGNETAHFSASSLRRYRPFEVLTHNAARAHADIVTPDASRSARFD
ncbi:COX15/CtaA family protein [Halomonas sp. hl-4]|uniref:COX15/CtaA family protein n=1 Tax=Halomonas sp. hl-4 TaxID=1761789 RepID=UPI000BB88872|nr:COX15/CtaA family protein [Halomonas sp. hl-4]SNY96202.1 cytochrome c oxidase assembly protein subunit 15 [Halomonas sp. hl-4]